MTPAAAIANPRRARHWLLWLALVLAAAHCLATWHVYSHTATQQAERASKSRHAGPDSCVVCLAAAGIGGAPTTPAGWLVAAIGQPGATPLHDLPPAQGPWAQPYAIRAPPQLGS